MLKWGVVWYSQRPGIAGFGALGTNAAPAVGELTRLLGDEEHAFTAVRCLVYVGKPAEASVWQALTNRNPGVRHFATQQLAWVTENNDAFFAHMKISLNDPNAEVRFAAVQGIGAQTDAADAAIPLLIKALDDQNDNVSSWAAKFLGDFGTNAMNALPVLSNAVVNGRSAARANQALRSLVAIAPEEALPLVLESFRSSDPHTRSASLVLLCKYPFDTPAIQSAIQQAAGDANPRVAQYAKRYITVQYEKEHPIESQFPNEPSHGGKPLGAWLKMHDREGRFSEDAKSALQEMGTNAIPALLKRLSYREPPFNLSPSRVNPEARMNMDAVGGLILLGEQAKPAIPQLESLMDAQDRDTPLHAMIAASGTGADAIPCFVKGLTNQSATVRGEAANFLGNLHVRFPQQCKEVLPLLLNLLNDSNQNVRMNAAQASKEIDAQAAARAGIK
jgi:HEAT repeat protein